MFRRKKKVVQPPAPKTIIVFGEVVVPEDQYEFEYEGYRIRYSSYYGKATVTGSCRQCGEVTTARVADHEGWDEVKRLTSLCEECQWYEQDHEEALAPVVGQIEDLEAKREILLTAFAAVPGLKRPESLSWDGLENAGLILHRQDCRSVLGFILIDYSREEIHRLVQTVDGQLEPFSRGFKLFLGTKYYKLFPGSYNWERGGHYVYHDHESYLDRLRKRRDEIEARAEGIKSKIDAYVVA